MLYRSSWPSGERLAVFIGVDFKRNSNNCIIRGAKGDIYETSRRSGTDERSMMYQLNASMSGNYSKTTYNLARLFTEFYSWTNRKFSAPNKKLELFSSFISSIIFGAAFELGRHE